MKQYALIFIALLCALTNISAQEFFNLTASDVKIDTLLPVFNHQFDLGANYADSTYEVAIEYQEFIDMTPTDVMRFHHISNEKLPELPAVSQYLAVDRKKGKLCVSFIPLVEREGKLQKLVSFKLALHGKPVSKDQGRC